ncbi:hypothetical protein BDV26DRAFT_285031 [Aspergillus bertholletiae]|uniref:Uncharacterized protein n=1 Tax=Aspergillus bertholletiae TaxID=1226010 RepID=A0A5N7AUN4_9EURO|nr:hypothetical protein BDV26DRAFT_285031 [Aspergillus bertholletiae]
MCWQICRTYQDCPHMYRYDYGKCSDAKARPNQRFCVGADGTMRSLERIIDPVRHKPPSALKVHIWGLSSSEGIVPSSHREINICTPSYA